MEGGKAGVVGADKAVDTFGAAADTGDSLLQL